MNANTFEPVLQPGEDVRIWELRDLGYLFDVSTDAEADVLTDLLVRAGIWWKCAACKFYAVETDERCPECGAEPAKGEQA